MESKDTCVQRKDICPHAPGKPQKCCNRKKNNLCHFKEKWQNIYRNTKKEEWKTDWNRYHGLQNQLQKQGRNYEILTHEEKKIYKEIISLREEWMNKYYKSECYTCDGGCVSHQNHIDEMKKKVANDTAFINWLKTNKSAKKAKKNAHATQAKNNLIAKVEAAKVEAAKVEAGNNNKAQQRLSYLMTNPYSDLVSSSEEEDNDSSDEGENEKKGGGKTKRKRKLNKKSRRRRRKTKRKLNKKYRRRKTKRKFKKKSRRRRRKTKRKFKKKSHRRRTRKRK